MLREVFTLPCSLFIRTEIHGQKRDQGLLELRVTSHRTVGLFHSFGLDPLLPDVVDQLFHDCVLKLWYVLRTEVPGLCEWRLYVVLFVCVVAFVHFAVQQPGYEESESLFADVIKDVYGGETGELRGHACQESLLDVEWPSLATCVDL